MSISNSDYSKMTDKASPNSPVVQNCIRAFLFGGGICLFAQVLNTLYEKIGLNADEVKLATPSTVIIITAILTGIGVFDKIARYAGAGTIVPITGFANSIAAPAVEFQTEGLILGTCAKMFTIAGPVLVFGTAASAIYGLIYWIWTLF